MNCIHYTGLTKLSTLLSLPWLTISTLADLLLKHASGETDRQTDMLIAICHIATKVKVKNTYPVESVGGVLISLT